MNGMALLSENIVQRFTISPGGRLGTWTATTIVQLLLLLFLLLRLLGVRAVRCDSGFILMSSTATLNHSHRSCGLCMA